MPTPAPRCALPPPQPEPCRMKPKSQGDGEGRGQHHHPGPRADPGAELGTRGSRRVAHSACSARSSSHATCPLRQWRITSSIADAARLQGHRRGHSSSPRSGLGQQVGLEGARPGGAQGLSAARPRTLTTAWWALRTSGCRRGSPRTSSVRSGCRSGYPLPSEPLRQQSLGLSEQPVRRRRGRPRARRPGWAPRPPGRRSSARAMSAARSRWPPAWSRTPRGGGPRRSPGRRSPRAGVPRRARR